MPERLKKAKKKVVGTKQTLKNIENKKVKVVYIAENADERVVSPIIKLCENQEVEIVYVETKEQLGLLCGIQVGAAAAAFTDGK